MTLISLYKKYSIAGLIKLSIGAVLLSTFMDIYSEILALIFVCFIDLLTGIWKYFTGLKDLPSWKSKSFWRHIQSSKIHKKVKRFIEYGFAIITIFVISEVILVEYNTTVQILGRTPSWTEISICVLGLAEGWSIFENLDEVNSHKSIKFMLKKAVEKIIS
tara:strand:- start:234 stop:716 length:483 start_codon:yes stop_codon:yes gene_type:complete